MTPTIATCLWFDSQGLEAAELYVSLFPDSRIVSTFPYPEGAPGPAGSVMLVTFELAGARFQALNGGPHFRFTEAVSVAVTVETQDEVDRLWDALTADGGEPGQCGWLKDRFGLSWQIVPAALERLDPQHDADAYTRAMQLVLTMTKPDVAAIERAATGA